jgi:N-glycosylase/DNA lyase
MDHTYDHNDVVYLNFLDMKFWKIIYWVAIIALVIFSAFAFSLHWIYFGVLSSAVAIGGILNYFDIIANNPHWNASTTHNRQLRSRRAEYFRSLSEEEKEEYIEQLEKELEKTKELIR